jgi:hypothetical protein
MVTQPPDSQPTVLPVASSLAGYALPSLNAYRILFAICAGSAILGAFLAPFIPTSTQTMEASKVA